LEATSHRLTSEIRLVLLLLELKFNLNTWQTQQLAFYFGQNIDDENETGWEEMAFASLTHLLKAGLTDSDQSHQPAYGSQLKSLSDVGKLKQQISGVLTRIAEGARVRE